MISLRFDGSGIHQNKGKKSMTQPTFKRPRPTSFGQKNAGGHGSFRGGGTKGASSNNRI